MISRSVFTSRLMPSTKVVSIREVSECVEVTASLSRPEKVQYFGSVGIDYDNVEKYGPVVERLNKLVEKKNNDSFFERLYRIHIATMFCVSYVWH